MSAQAGESILGVHIMLQLSPEPKPVCSSEDDLQNRVNFDFVKNNIIATSPNRPAYSSNPHPDDDVRMSLSFVIQGMTALYLHVQTKQLIQEN